MPPDRDAAPAQSMRWPNNWKPGAASAATGPTQAAACGLGISGAGLRSQGNALDRRFL